MHRSQQSRKRWKPAAAVVGEKWFASTRFSSYVGETSGGGGGGVDTNRNMNRGKSNSRRNCSSPAAAVFVLLVGIWSQAATCCEAFLSPAPLLAAAPTGNLRVSTLPGVRANLKHKWCTTAAVSKFCFCWTQTSTQPPQTNTDRTCCALCVIVGARRVCTYDNTTVMVDKCQVFYWGVVVRNVFCSRPVSMSVYTNVLLLYC